MQKLSDFKSLVGLMKECIKEYGLWPTVGAICVLLFGGAVLGIAWRLPDLLAVLK